MQGSQVSNSCKYDVIFAVYICLNKMWSYSSTCWLLFLTGIRRKVLTKVFILLESWQRQRSCSEVFFPLEVASGVKFCIEASFFESSSGTGRSSTLWARLTVDYDLGRLVWHFDAILCKKIASFKFQRGNYFLFWNVDPVRGRLAKVSRINFVLATDINNYAPRLVYWIV